MTFTVYLCLGFELFGLFYVFNHFPDRLATLQKILIAVSGILVSIYLSGDEIQKENEKKSLHVKLGSERIVKKYNDTLRNWGFKWCIPNEFTPWIELSKVSQNQALRSQLVTLKIMEKWEIKLLIKIIIKVSCLLHFLLMRRKISASKF